MFLLPLILFYEFASVLHGDLTSTRVIAFEALQRFFELFGPVGKWTPALAAVTILLATHVAAHEPWKIHWRRVALMYPESLVWAIPLLLLNWAVPLSTAIGGDWGLVSRMALGVGAGVYEELVFRLILISLVLIVGADLLHGDRKRVAVIAVIASALLFAAHHHKPIGTEEFDAVRFIFRAASGLYLAAIFWFRGYGPAAGCHAAYNVSLAIISALGR